MATKISDVLFSTFPDLRYQPTAKRVRAMVGGTAVVDTLRRSWCGSPDASPPSMRFPKHDLRAELAPPGQQAGEVPEHSFALSRRGGRHWIPERRFGKHTVAGEELDVVTGMAAAPGPPSGRRTPTWPGYVILAFPAFDWLEDDEEIIGHP